MGESAKAVTRGWVDLLIGTIVLAGALVALSFPVYLGTYDRWGLQISCGNGYYSKLPQAAAGDESYVDQCKSALLHRRAWTMTVGAVGALIIVPELVAWARRGSARAAETTHHESAEPADLHGAALMDRRYRSHRERPSDTTL